MNPTQPRTVLEKIVSACTLAWQSRTPLILLDTEEQELAEAAALEVFAPRIRWEEADLTAADEAYFRAMGAGEEVLRTPVNLSRNLADLKDLIPSPSLTDRRMAPRLFVLHLTRSSWKVAREETTSMADALRAWTEEYLRCPDNQSALRCSLVLLYGDVTLLPRDLLSHTRIVEVDYPDRLELMDLVCRMAEENGTPLERKEDAVHLAESLAGFSLMDARRNLRSLLYVSTPEGTPLLYDPEQRDDILREAKKQVLLARGGLLSLYRREAGTSRLGGLEALGRWLSDYRDQMLRSEEYARERGTLPLKGVLLCGVPGCGKSEAAKVLQQTWNLPMVQLNVDQLMGGLVGDSERNMREALKQAEAMAPCIVWVEELDKAFSGSNRNSQDNAASKRMFGRFLMWMQENRRPCFIFATANDIGQLPPEFFRSGRFDELFSVFLPTFSECAAILREHMRRADALHTSTCQGSGREVRPLFEGFCDGENPAGCTGCYSTDTIHGILRSLVTPKGTRFVSGADLAKIVANALRRLPHEAFSAPLSSLVWTRSVRAVLEDPSLGTICSGRGSLDQIAVCYARLLRGNFVPAAGSSQVLLTREHCEQALRAAEEGRRWDISALTAQRTPYDRALIEALAARLPEIARLVERNELARLVQ